MAPNKKNKKKAPNWNTGKVAVAKPKEYEYFLMLEKEADVTTVIDALKEKQMPGLDVWPSMGVFLIELSGNNNQVEFEQLNIEETFAHPSDHAFVRNRNIHTVYNFIATEEQIEQLKPYFKEIVALFGGFACMDSEDFQPTVEL
mgnify:CR=1 FL=1